LLLKKEFSILFMNRRGVSKRHWLHL